MPIYPTNLTLRSLDSDRHQARNYELVGRGSIILIILHYSKSLPSNIKGVYNLILAVLRAMA
jgi:hypothetical protein